MRQQIEEMGLVVAMVRTAMEALGCRDLELALKVLTMDDLVDRLNRNTHLRGAEARRTILRSSIGACT